MFPTEIIQTIVQYVGPDMVLTLQNITLFDNRRGKTFTFSPLSDNCKNEFEKNNAKDCIKKFLNDKLWHCISLSKNQIIYVSITLENNLNHH